jgi:hypothetical protein
LHAAAFTARNACTGKRGQKKSPAHKAPAISFFPAPAARDIAAGIDP